MKLFSAEQIRRADAYTIRHEPIRSIDLMERASAVFSNWFYKNFGSAKCVLVLAGSGNNGGDGLAISRILQGRGLAVTTILLNPAGKLSNDCRMNLERLQRGGLDVIIISDNEQEFPDSRNFDTAIDAIFGTGLSRPAEGLFAKWIEWFNALQIKRISVDLPSGMFTDEESNGSIVKAHHTFAFEILKRSMLLPGSDEYTGEVHVGKIGLSGDFFENEPCDWYLSDFSSVKPNYKSRSSFSHKGKNGKALIIAGSPGKNGAALLATAACIRSGAGLTTLAGHGALEFTLNTYMPEAMFLKLDQQTPFADWWENIQYKALGIGPGIGTNAFAKSIVELSFKNTTSPMVLDADALNIVAANPELWNDIPKQSILTPHPGEFQRLCPNAKSRLDQIDQAQRLAVEHQVFIVLKGAFTCIACPDSIFYFNSSGNAGMAKGGTGDVLTGILTGLLAQGYESEHAARLGVWIHGHAADLAISTQSIESLTAGDIISNLGNAFKTLL